MFQRQSPELRHLTTAHLAQTMTLLGLTVTELRQKIEAELARNPALELVDENRCPSCRRKLRTPGLCPACSQPKSVDLSEPIVFLSERQESFSFGGGLSEDLPDDNFAPEAPDLPTYVLRQIATELDPSERLIAAHILTSLNDDGLLTTSLLDIARYLHVPPSKVERVLKLIQRADPVGVGSATPQQALLVQLEVLDETRPVPAQAARVVLEGMDLLSRKQYGELARRLGLSQRAAEDIARFIQDNLYPFPARAHWGDVRQGSPSTPAAYHQPDMLVHLLDERNLDSPLVVEVLTPLRGTLRVNPLFRAALSEADPKKLEAWKTDLEQASLLIKCLQQRNNTMRRLAVLLSKRQRAFILHGDSQLTPMTRASLAEELGVHESTISRAVSDKSVQLPNGHIIPMERFFDRSLHVRTALKRIIEQEGNSLTDTQLVERLSEQGYQIARRTVAKYRAMEGILPARLRQPESAAALRTFKNQADALRLPQVEPALA